MLHIEAVQFDFSSISSNTIERGVNSVPGMQFDDVFQSAARDETTIRQAEESTRQQVLRRDGEEAVNHVYSDGVDSASVQSDKQPTKVRKSGTTADDAHRDRGQSKRIDAKDTLEPRALSGSKVSERGRIGAKLAKTGFSGKQARVSVAAQQGDGRLAVHKAADESVFGRAADESDTANTKSAKRTRIGPPSDGALDRTSKSPAANSTNHAARNDSDVLNAGDEFDDAFDDESGELRSGTRNSARGDEAGLIASEARFGESAAFEIVEAVSTDVNGLHRDAVDPVLDKPEAVRGRTDAKSRVSVLDLRSVVEENSQVKGDPVGNSNRSDAPSSGDGENGQFDIRYQRMSGVTDRGNNGAPQTGETTTRTFSQMLRETMAPEIVRQSGIILRDANRGEIRLVLKPEHLGRMRIRLELQDGRVTGRILVDNSAVKDAVERNLGALERSFLDHGFQTATLEVGVGGEREQQRNGAHGTAVAELIHELEESVPSVGIAVDSTINLMV